MSLLWSHSISANGVPCLHAPDANVTTEMQFAWKRKILLRLFAVDLSSLSTKRLHCPGHNGLIQGKCDYAYFVLSVRGGGTYIIAFLIWLKAVPTLRPGTHFDNGCSCSEYEAPGAERRRLAHLVYWICI